MMSASETALLTHPHNYYHNPPSNAWEISVADSVGLCLATVFVVTRCYTKFRITKSPGWEDLASVVALLCFIIFCALGFAQRFQFGGGRHTWDLPPEYYNGYLTTGAVSSYFYIWGTMLAKLSLLLFLYRIFSIDFKFRIAAWVLGVTLLVWSTVSFLLMIFGCHPVRANWNVMLYLDPKTHCYPKAYNVLNIHGFCNIITDFGLLFLPIPMVWKLHMDLKKKLGLAAVFATGAFICAVAIVRQYILYNTPKAGDNWSATRNRIWMSLEFSFSIVVACLPALAPFFKRFSMLASLIPSSIRSRFSTRSSSVEKRAPWPAHKLPNSSSQTDVERGAVRRNEHKPHSSWQVPRAWHEQGFDDFDRASEGSDLTLQPVMPTHRELKHKD